MKIYKTIKPCLKEHELATIATLGTFDGVHIGHRQILNRVMERAQQTGRKSAVLTFGRHPITIIKPDIAPRLLTTLDEKLAIFDKMGIDIVFVVKFTQQIANLTAEQFIKKYLIDCLGMKYFIVGYDHSFGKNRKGTLEKIREQAENLRYKLEVLQPVKKENMVVKSSIIRNLISEGKVELASSLLGENYYLGGKVITGRGHGVKIGFPTANILPEDADKIIPANGVYAGWLEIEDIKMDAVIAIGPQPTFGLTEESIEVHIPDYIGELYRKKVKISFLQRLRNIEKFDSQQALIQQIKHDIEKSKQILIN